MQETIKTTEKYKISDWERSINPEDGIEFFEFNISSGMVTKASGYYHGSKKRYFLEWDMQGRCYHLGKRVSQYDIKLKHYEV